MILIDLIYNLAVLVALSIISGFIDIRFRRTSFLGKISQGLLFGVTAIIGMLYPFHLVPGIIFDGRSIIISLCTLFFGPISGSLASIIAGTFRIYLGGGGAETGIFVILSSFLIGLIFFYIKKSRPDIIFTNFRLYIFGFIVNGIMLFIFWTLPVSDKFEMYWELTPTILGVYPFATLLIGKILLDQEEKYNYIKKIRESAELFRTTLYSIGDAVITTDLNGNVKQINSAAEHLTGWLEKEAVDQPLGKIFKVINEETRKAIESPVKKVLTEGTISGLISNTLLISKEGKEIPISDSASPIKDENGEILGIVLVFIDETETRKAQNEILNLNRLYGMLSQSNQAIVRLKNKEDLFIELCKVAVNFGHFDLAWIAIYDEEEKTIKPHCWFGKEHGILTNDYQKISDSEKVKFPGISSYYKNQINVTNNLKSVDDENPWRELLIKNGFNSVASTPIRMYDNTLGVFILYSYKINSFGTSESRLLEEIGTDISFALEKYDKEEKNILINEELKKREEEFREIYNSTNESIFINDAITGKFIDCNIRAVEMYGYSSKEEILEGNIEDISANISPYNEDEAQRLIQKAINEGPQSFEWIGKKKSGENFWVGISLRKTEIGGKDRILAVVRDISVRKKAEEELLAAKERMQLLVEGTPHLFYYIQDQNLKITYVSPSILSITGRTVEDWLSQSHWYVTDSPLNIEAKKRTKENIRGKISSVPIYVEIMHKNGNPILLEIYERPIFKGNEVIGLQGVAHDITEKEATEKKLRLLSRSIDQSPVSVVITDVNGRIEYINPKFTELTGYSTEEAIGNNPNILKSDHYDKEFYKNLWDTILSGKDIQCEFLNKKKNGELFWENAIISPIFNNEKKITHFVAVKEDITEKKKIIEDLVIAKEKAEEMNKVKSYFFASMSHELRTPFVGIQGFAELLSEKVKEQEEKELVEGIISSANRLTDTLNKILSLSKMEIEEIELSLSEINVNELLNDVYKTFTTFIKKKNLEFKLVKVEPDINIKSDEKLLTGILNNLLSNAIKFTDEGWIELKSLLVSHQGQDYLQLSVTDTGVGIPDEKRDQIWLAFRQVSEGLNRGFEGTGLGLTITKRYVDRLGGKILLKSNAGKGSSFNVEIPITAVKAGKKQAIAMDDFKQSSYAEEQKNIGSKKLLYVEDDIYAQKIVARILEQNYEIEFANDADVAQIKLKEKNYDLILIDINLRTGLDGVQLMQVIRKIPYYKHIPIVAITAYASQSDRDEFLTKGFSHYISKPFPLKALSDLVDSIFK